MSGFKLVWLLLSMWLPGECRAAGPPPVYRNTDPDIRYVGSSACAGCHRAIYEKFIRTPMGKSVTATKPTGFPLPGSAEIASLNRRFEVFEKEGRVFQSETELADGRTTFRREEPLAWAIGSGENGITFAIERGGYLFEAPLSYYSAVRRWDLSPGYEAGDIGFSRPISAACMVCHSGRSQPVPGR
ncbi:MAG TPA: hypothetical protein VHB50_15555, partial [Bryobacteraceae bacterium]|nr:hypothetical protein [Bryobacteraceae bacterium]